MGWLCLYHARISIHPWRRAIDAEAEYCRSSRELFERVPTQQFSWLLDRLVRDHDAREKNADRSSPPPRNSTGNVSLLVHIFDAERGPVN